ncbi:hypothetical protein C8R44DRAFT_868728 [Mycena epipterygia]|nr:hypothetical protein C8R44DRAFT_868728 [Mycena epipterygia]
MFSSVLAISFLSALGSVVGLGPASVNLRGGNFAILAEAGVSIVPLCHITGNVGVSIIAGTGLTGFSLAVDSTGQFCTSSQVIGKLFATSYVAPTPAILTLAIGDMGTAFTDATSRVNHASGVIGGLIFPPGLYKWTSAVSIGGDITFAGGATDTWIFQVVMGAVTAGAGLHLEGVILARTQISLQTGTTANSQLLAQASVVLQQHEELFQRFTEIMDRAPATSTESEITTTFSSDIGRLKSTTNEGRVAINNLTAAVNELADLLRNFNSLSCTVNTICGVSRHALPSASQYSNTRVSSQTQPSTIPPELPTTTDALIVELMEQGFGMEDLEDI